MNDIIYLFIGALVGGVGTLVGAGGGFLLTPLFIFLYPQMPADRLTALSLLAVSANSMSGSLGYALRKQVHLKSTILYSLAALPGVLLGVYIGHHLPRSQFELIFGSFLIIMSFFVLWRSRHHKKQTVEKHFWNQRSIFLGSFISFFIGILSSLLGIGGGIIHVPLLSEVLNYPIHTAAGTSHAILAITSLVAVLKHLIDGDLTPLPSFAPYLVLGLVFGAQIGAALSKKVPRHYILRVLGVALVVVGFRLIYKNI